PVVSVVLRAARAVAERDRLVDQIDDATVGVIRSGSHRSWSFHRGARQRTGARRHSGAVSWSRTSGHRPRLDAVAALSLRAAADGVSHHPAAAHIGDNE